MNLWDELAARCYMSRGYVKNAALLTLYSGGIDPWLDYIVMSELRKLQNGQ
jgi:hypothetical protein